MIRLQASYGLKVPTAREYSSEQFHASAEIEVADAVQGEALKATLGALWNDLKSAVDAQLAAKVAPVAGPQSATGGNNGHNGNGHQQAAVAHVPANGNGHPPQAVEPVNRIANSGGGEPASKKQIGFMLALARRHKNLSAEQTRNWLQAEHGLRMNQMTKADAAGVIDQLQGK
ncbi:MAG: hypothetical protein IT462_14475 [Planctomycetes bacterium]|nr:hypothetical protein [Planctomycetota bacterium]